MDAKRIAKLADELAQQQSVKAQALSCGRTFTELFFKTMESVLIELCKECKEVGRPSQRGRDDGHLGLSFALGEDKLTFVLYDTAAAPFESRDYETMLMPEQYLRTPAAALVLFAGIRTGPPNPILRIYIFPDGKWHPFGLILSTSDLQDQLDEMNAEKLVFSILDGYMGTLHRHWRPLNEMTPTGIETQRLEPIGFKVSHNPSD